MGKKAKEHRKKVAKRNATIKQKKSAMQKAFDMLIQQQLEKMKEQDVKVESNGQEMNFEIVEDKYVDHAFKFTPNDEESAKINKQFEEELPTEE